MIEPQMKYFVYNRKSSEPDERQALSIESQENENTKLAKRHEITSSQLIKPFLRESHSAKTGNTRPLFNQMAEAIKNEVANGIICWQPDRLSRNNEDMTALISLLESGKLIEIITNSQVFRNNPLDKFMFGFLCLQAKLENDKKGVDVKRGLRTKAEKGWLPSGAKPGYMNDPYAPMGSKTVKKDPVSFDIIKRAWKTIIEGTKSPIQVYRMLNEDWGYRTPKHKRSGGKPMAKSQFYRMLADTFYYGDYEYPIGSGNWHHGKHEPMITKDEFDYVQAMLGRGGTSKPQKHNFTYQGTMRCGECKASITAEEKWQIICTGCKYKFDTLRNTRSECPKCQFPVIEMANPKVLHYIYYCCTKKINPKCSQRSVEVKELERQIGVSLDNIHINEEFTTWALEVLNDWSESEVVDRNAILNSQEVAYNDCIKRLDNLVALKICPQNSDNSLLSDIEFAEQKAKLAKEKTQIEEQMKQTGERIDKWLKLSVDTFNFARYAKYWFENGEPEDKKIIFAALGSNLTLMDKKVCMDNLKPFELISSSIKETPQISSKSEPNKNVVSTAQTSTEFSKIPSLLSSKV
jgi:DNA invertase Pin-like site-specific DNA recombinase